MCKNIRKINVNATSGYKYEDTPTIQIKGKYLESIGYPIETPLIVNIYNDKIVITPQKQS